MQDALRSLSDYWSERGCLIVQPFNTEVGAGTMNPATVLRVLGPEPWDVAYVEPSVRPDDSRYGENPNRLQTHTQFQVILKPDPGDPQDLYLGSLAALGVDLAAHDVRFVEDNWAQPAIGAWGLGWEVWLDGMEITQFTYFQAVGGRSLDPIPVELTYGMERIMMSLQRVNHFKDIVYSRTASGAPVTYGEAFGQQEYEMSRYFLDEADVEATWRMYRLYVAEAARMVEAGLPVPAHGFVLKSSHAFNVLDSRGAISTTERAEAFATMRKLMRQTGELWVARREELGFPLLPAASPSAEPAQPQTEADGDQAVGGPSGPAEFALEIGVEELPPHVVATAADQVREALERGLAASRLPHGTIRVDATPRRVVATVADVAPAEPDWTQVRKGPKWAAAFDEDGAPTKALAGFARGQGVTTDQVVKREIGGVEHACVETLAEGRPAGDVLAGVVSDAVRSLRAEKNMRWGDPELCYSRAIRWLVALHGSFVAPARVSSLVAGRVTRLLRGTGVSPSGVPLGLAEIPDAAALRPTLAKGGIALPFAERRAGVVSAASELAEAAGARIDFEAESDLVDEIANLVEAPHAILGSFDPRYLELPDRLLTAVMRKHLRFLPLRAADGRLDAGFVALANGECDDDVVRAGNESVLRSRYEDALFFWNTDLRAGSASQFVEGLERLTFENRLGSMGRRARRIEATALELSERVKLSAAERATLERAGELAKFDLATQLVVEMSSLVGFVAREYAVRLGESPEVADALYEMEQPRSGADELPRGRAGALLSLADRFDLLMALFALGAKPTGSSDPHGLRRAALGVARVMRSRPEFDFDVFDGLRAAAARLADQGVAVSEEAIAQAGEFVVARFAQLMRDEGVSAELVAAVLPGASRPAATKARLDEIAALASRPDFRDLVTAWARVHRILPAGGVAPTPTGAWDSAAEPAEEALRAAASRLGPPAVGLEAFLDQHAGMVQGIDRFFEEVLVMAEDPDVRASRLALLAQIRDRFPGGVDIDALGVALA